LYPVATVILGGLFSSTLLDFFVHPALFWLAGLKAARQVVRQSAQQADLSSPLNSLPPLPVPGVSPG
jgi:hypothetical protein